jgi:mRNA interferase MazF
VVSEVRQGEVYWLDFGAPVSSAPAERRPCVVVQSDTFNQTRIGTTVVCLITSNMTRGLAPGNVVLRKGEGNLRKQCVVNVSQLLTVDKDELVDRIGKLRVETIDAIRSGLAVLFERV